MNFTGEKYFFDNGRGEKLAGILEMPKSAPRLFAVFGPCFTCTKESHGAIKTSRALAARGIATLRFDTTGVGASEGNLAETNFTTRITDIRSAAAALTKTHQAPQLLLGHSISGAAILSAVQYIPSTRALATICAPRDPEAVIARFRRQGQLTEKDDTVELNVLGRITVFNKSFIEDMLSQNTAADTAKIQQKLFIFHAPHDDIVSAGNAQDIYNRATSADRELVMLDDNATHLFEKRADDAEFIADKISAYFF